MSIEQKLKVAEPDSPTRCQAQGDNGEGQCKWEAVPGTRNCAKHRGIAVADGMKAQKLHDYRLQIWATRVNEFAESEHLRNLRGEVGILRMLLEQVITSCQNQEQLVIYSGRISSLVASIERVLVTCERLETKMGMVLDKSAALILASRVVDVITKHVSDPNVCDAISNGIINILSSLGKEENGSV